MEQEHDPPSSGLSGSHFQNQNNRIEPEEIKKKIKNCCLFIFLHADICQGQLEKPGGQLAEQYYRRSVWIPARECD